MTHHVICMMTDLYCEDDPPKGSKLEIASKQCGWLGQVPHPQQAMLTLAGTPNQPNYHC